MANKIDVMGKVTEQIINQLEQGTVPWQKPWFSINDRPNNPYTPTVYSGLNSFTLGLSMAVNGWSDPRFATYRQIKQAGGQVQKGEKGIPVVYYVPIYTYGETAEGEERQVKFMKAKYYTVFNIAAQSEGIELEPLPQRKPLEPDEVLSKYDGPTLVHAGNVAYYSPANDKIVMPAYGQFASDADYRGTLYHEYIHSTGIEDRLNRPGVAKIDTRDIEKYSTEELVAELGASMLRAIAGIDMDIQNSASYIDNWLEKLKSDRSIIATAAREAEKAVLFILGEIEEEPEGEAV